VEVEHAMRMLGDLGGMLGQMTPEAQKRNLHRIFTRIELNDQGEAVRVEVKPWVMRAFEPMLGSTPVYRTYYAEGGSQPQFMDALFWWAAALFSRPASFTSRPDTAHRLHGHR
jgi:hypothetical protein